MKAVMISKEGPKKKSAGGIHTRIIKRNAKGGLEEAPGTSITATEIYSDDNSRKQAAKPGSGTFDGSAAPRVGGGAPIQKDGPVAGGSRKQMRTAKMRVNKSAASPAAKASARRLYR